jgi:hypothetical protein
VRGRLELEPGETLLVITNASFRGAAAASVRSTFAMGSARLRQRSYEDWRHAVEIAGFPTAGPEMLLGLTEQRVVVCRATVIGRRPSRFIGSLPLERIAAIATERHGLVTGLAFALRNNQIVEVEAMRARRLRRFASELAERLR